MKWVKGTVTKNKTLTRALLVFMAKEMAVVAIISKYVFRVR